MSNKYKKLGINQSYDELPYGLEVFITTQSSFSQNQNIQMVFNLKNNGRSPVWILKKNIPIGGIFSGDTFEVNRGSVNVGYSGFTVSDESALGVGSYIKIDSKQTYSSSFNPSLSYEMSTAGSYSIKYKGILGLRNSAPALGLSESAMGIEDGGFIVPSLDPEQFIEPSISRISNFLVSERSVSTLEVIELGGTIIESGTSSLNSFLNESSSQLEVWTPSRISSIVTARDSAITSINNALGFFNRFLINGSLNFTSSPGCVLQFGQDPNASSGPKCGGNACGWFGFVPPQVIRTCNTVCQSSACRRDSGKWKCPLTKKKFGNKAVCESNCRSCSNQCSTTVIDSQSQRAVFVRDKLIAMRSFLQSTQIQWILSNSSKCGCVVNPNGLDACTYTYTTQRDINKIWVCPQALTSALRLRRRVIHESAHLNGICCDHSEQITVRGGNEDSQVMSLAGSNPARALENADTYAAFVMNACAAFCCS